MEKKKKRIIENLFKIFEWEEYICRIQSIKENWRENVTEYLHIKECSPAVAGTSWNFFFAFACKCISHHDLLNFIIQV